MTIHDGDKFGKTFWNDVDVTLPKPKGGVIPETENSKWIDEIFNLKAKADKASSEFKKTQELLAELNKQAETKWQVFGTSNSPIYWKDNKYATSSSATTMQWSAPTTFTVKTDAIDQKAIELLFGIKTKKIEYVPGENCIF